MFLIKQKNMRDAYILHTLISSQFLSGLLCTNHNYSEYLEMQKICPNVFSLVNEQQCISQTFS
jgi:hypothetical protein